MPDHPYFQITVVSSFQVPATLSGISTHIYLYFYPWLRLQGKASSKWLRDVTEHASDLLSQGCNWASLGSGPLPKGVPPSNLKYEEAWESLEPMNLYANFVYPHICFVFPTLGKRDSTFHQIHLKKEKKINLN